ncbi:RAB7A-interacting MON1-CCZ1 complex subunit 1-like [Lineus longissimus]|uniref:RAB7A-interacting MON1-CCZ1 complex subunit 1-like n=1 Tax=Lineus longissimus TaxID=88925 RepID=UPI002B4CB67E
MAAPMKIKTSHEKIEKETKSLLQACKDVHKTIDYEDPFLKRCEENCARVLRSEGKTDTDVAQQLKDFSQASLDLTFYEENNLVNESFPEKDGKQRLQKLLESLTMPEKLVEDLFQGEKQAKDVLGDEIYECLLWRRGALLYMYCSIIQPRSKSDPNQYRQCLEDGVDYLMRMLKVRTPILKERQDVTTNDEAVYQLLQKGIFSDTHVLAMMYAGEMCHWHWSDPAPSQSDFDARNIGRSLLSKYIELVKGPLKTMGWNCERADQLLKDADK